MRSYWNFKLRVESKKTPYTKDILKELDKLLDNSELISHHEIEEA